MGEKCVPDTAYLRGIFDINSSYWLGGNIPAGTPDTLPVCPALSNIRDMAGLIFANHVNLLLDNRHTGRDYEVQPNEPVNVKELAPGTLVLLDQESLTSHSRAVRKYPALVIDASQYPKQALYEIHSLSKDFATNPQTRYVRHSEYWAPENKVVVSNGKKGAEFKAYIRDTCVAMALPTKQGTRLFRPHELKKFVPRQGEATDPVWIPLRHPSVLTLNHLRLTGGRRGNRKIAIERLRGVLLYANSTAAMPA